MIVRVGDRAVGNADELVVAVRRPPVGARSGVLLRDGREMTVTVPVTLTAR